MDRDKENSCWFVLSALYCLLLPVPTRNYPTFLKKKYSSYRVLWLLILIFWCQIPLKCLLMILVKFGIWEKSEMNLEPKDMAHRQICVHCFGITGICITIKEKDYLALIKVQSVLKRNLHTCQSGAKHHIIKWALITGKTTQRKKMIN